MMRNCIFFAGNRLEWSPDMLYTESCEFDCAKAFALLASGCDVRLKCTSRELWSHCRAHYRIVYAAGGVVSAMDGRMLMIRREGVWDLPKGMTERGETHLAAALREVKEETGVAALPAGRVPLLKTYHIYDKYGGWHMKQTSWYVLRTDCAARTVPQGEEGIEAAEWVEPAVWARRLRNSYASLRLLAEMVVPTVND
ncbi:MAG: NUDIX hydrolase [bacterium P3]|nr:MAG: NUDIX hydrolase [bacterium P3]KWW42197.1 MAG: NUDIX hydrolase [bacterium F083]